MRTRSCNSCARSRSSQNVLEPNISHPSNLVLRTTNQLTYLAITAASSHERTVGSGWSFPYRCCHDTERPNHNITATTTMNTTATRPLRLCSISLFAKICFGERTYDRYSPTLECFIRSRHICSVKRNARDKDRLCQVVLSQCKVSPCSHAHHRKAHLHDVSAWLGGVITARDIIYLSFVRHWCCAP